jgi:hypothetical protein
MDRHHWTRAIAKLDPSRDYLEINQLLAKYEFSWDLTQSLSLALFRTYAVPSIGRLLFDTGELTTRTQKRYDDTALILEAILEHGFASGDGHAALRRMNQMHGAYDISNDDMRYVLTTFVVVPIRWIDEFGWRPFTAAECVASVNYHRELGRHMGIKNIPTTYIEFAELLDDYEAKHFAYDPKCRAVADATLDLVSSFPGIRLAPKSAVRRVAFAVMDDALLDAFHYPRPTAPEQAAVRAALKARAIVVGRLPAPKSPVSVRELPTTRSYPNGYRIAELGSFPRGCPAHASAIPLRH